MTDRTSSRRTISFSWILRGIAIISSLWLVSCATVPELGGMMDRGDSNGRRIVVNLKSQQATLYHHGKVVAVAPISSGREGKGTPVGRFSVIQKSPNHRSSLYGNYVMNGRIVKENVDNRKTPRPAGSKFEGVPMPYFLRFTGAYGLHAGNVPGYPASSGCVRLPKRHAKRFFDAVKVGTPVIIQR
jgi:lipoprotein-anchoring transpeptidase ErfK/SrfK